MSMFHGRRPWYSVAFIFVALGALAACVPAIVPVPPLSTVTLPAVVPQATVPATATATVEPTPAPSATALPSVYFASGLPAELRARVLAALGAGYAESADAAAAVRVMPGEDGPYRLAEYIFVPVVAFPTFADDVAWADIQAFWSGQADRLGYLSNDGQAPTLLLDASTLAALSTLLGPPAPAAPIQIVPPADVAGGLWKAGAPAWGIVPFDALEPRMKALTVDRASVLSKQLDPRAYPLRYSASLAAAPEVAAALGVQKSPWLNRDPERMTVLMMTGVTALGRATAWKMELNGVLYPDRQVRDILLDHDLLHISNEVSFANDCPYPDPNGDTRFCASPKYIDLLRDIHVDIVELSGNHNEDWGPEAATLTLQMYEKEGWKHFAGGWNAIDATRPLTVTDHGNTLVFLGCNPVGPEYAWAGPDYPGSAVCDYPNLYAQVARARQAGAIPIVTWQYQETYQYAPTPEQVADFRAMADAGAVIVSGSQAHQPQGFDFYKDAFIHYGVGNLFFDQMDILGTRQEFADQHVLYDGRLLSTRLFTFMLEDYAQPRPMTAAERLELLTSTFQASGWLNP